MNRKVLYVTPFAINYHIHEEGKKVNPKCAPAGSITSRIRGRRYVAHKQASDNVVKLVEGVYIEPWTESFDVSPFGMSNKYRRLSLSLELLF